MFSLNMARNFELFHVIGLAIDIEMKFDRSSPFISSYLFLGFIHWFFKWNKLPWKNWHVVHFNEYLFPRNRWINHCLNTARRHYRKLNRMRIDSNKNTFIKYTMKSLINSVIHAINHGHMSRSFCNHSPVLHTFLILDVGMENTWTLEKTCSW